MKIKKAFSTLGCPGWSFNEIFATAKDLGLDAIEIRGIGNQMYAPKIDIFSEENINDVIERMKKVDMKFSLLASGCDLSDDSNWELMLKEAKEYIDIANKLGTEYIRVFCESTPHQQKQIDLKILVERYQKICDYALDKKVYPLIETNGFLANSNNMLNFLKLVDRKNAFVLWDIHHPYRFFNENPYYTAKKLKDLVKYVHVKDSVMKDNAVNYRILGYGDVPVLDCLKALTEFGFDGFVSLEWVKRWCPDLQEAGIVFSHYVNYMHTLETQI